MVTFSIRWTKQLASVCGERGVNGPSSAWAKESWEEEAEEAEEEENGPGEGGGLAV